jgi:hypothetical protein
MVWNKASLVMNTNIQDLWPRTTLSAKQEYLVVCSLFSREQYNLQKDRLEGILDEMGKWIPPG